MLKATVVSKQISATAGSVLLADKWGRCPLLLQAVSEINVWGFTPADQRGQVFGQLVVADGYASNKPIFAKGAYVGLAAPGNLGSWQTQTKGYQFWTQADRKGGFFINKVRPGIYNLYAWVPGVVGDYKLDVVIAINPGSNTNMGLLTYNDIYL
ncbi:hypothetical protein SLEP1_g19996 [Rubroshorea leprosula]|uniref:Rhamnogalacturonan lyase domain-containing protein n=1 Tax=Rubroshorea leprosula TaxID=152421 RepID=A0AAV5J780_9ROSI|nr:hypothetical protein SLEP1_g19996 [Rubroshorea leprosula]